MTITLCGAPASDSSACVEAVLRLKDVPYRRMDRLPFLDRATPRDEGGPFTVPTVRAGDVRISGTRRILTQLDRWFPNRRLYPDTPAGLASIRAVEEWNATHLQPAVRRILIAAVRRAPKALDSYVEASPTMLPPWSRAVTRLPSIAFGWFVHNAAEHEVAADIAELPGHIERVDELISDGILGQPVASAADLQVAATLRLLSTIGDIQPLLTNRAAAQFAVELFPLFPGNVPGRLLPARWFADQLT
ncbi:MAG: hypothetical protein GEV04_08520 [Actinophytocola sp.]|nr:hypothetical protein [Actinophytocola sp.]